MAETGLWRVAGAANMAADWFRSLGFTMPYGVNVAGEIGKYCCCVPTTRSLCSGLVSRFKVPGRNVADWASLMSGSGLSSCM